MKNTLRATKWVTLATTMMMTSLPVIAAGGKGMTWGFRGYSFPTPPSTTNITGNRYVPSGNTSMHLLNLYVGCNALKHKWPYGYAGSWADNLGNVPANAPPHNINTTRSEMCNAYQGETSCSEKRHILCIKESGNIQRPPYDIAPGTKMLLSGWAPRQVKPSDTPMLGTQLTSRAVADSYCGTGWRMAEHHDGRWINGMNATNHHGASWNIANANSGGWAFHANLWGGQNQINVIKRERYWVAINNQPANCWNP